MFKKINSPPRTIDSFFLCLLVIFLTYNPFYLQGELNVYELELYLPAIDGILNGLVPYRDFFYLRGPFEIYLPAALMSIWGNKAAVLSTFFYVGNVLALLLSIAIARQFFQTRYIFFLFTLILTAKTFPRVVFTYWGGMRYCVGLVAVYFAILFFKTKKNGWLFLASSAAAAAFLTSIDVGICALGALVCSLIAFFGMNKEGFQHSHKAFKSFMAGLLFVFVPFLLFTAYTDSLSAYLEMTYQVATRMTTVINHHSIAEYPASFWEGLAAALNPSSKNFRHLTPMYLYLAFGLYLFFFARPKNNAQWLPLACLFFYGFLLYLVSFRSLWGSNFEMALQPEKILYFFLIERAYLFLTEKKRQSTVSLKSYWPLTKESMKVGGIIFLLVGLFMSSVCFSMMRFDRRYYSFQFVKYLILGKDVKELEPLSGEPKRVTSIGRLQGFIVPEKQAEELEGVVGYIQENTQMNEPLLAYPERGGMYSYLSGRPFVGRFPTATMSWFSDDWHEEFFMSIVELKPQYVIMPKDLQEEKFKVYFAYEDNKVKYGQVMSLINAQYSLAASTAASYIYERK